MRKQHEMETEFLNFMKEAFPHVPHDSSQFRTSKLIWASAGLAMFVKLNELATLSDGDSKVIEMMEGIELEIKYETELMAQGKAKTK